ncbi:MAG TPA: hypothetical protein PKD78_08895 [Saprospiraceae bacterium]|nr:hypothetical protein [Saprospiraceae bacterium]
MMHRYPGSRSFTSDYRHLFFGRDDEKQELFRLIVLNDLVVLFGESGSGKTSLLQAGVCPEMEESQYKPVFIRLNNTAESPEAQVCAQLKEGGYIPADMPEGLDLWAYFSRFWYVDLGERFRPVIVFDQFEELFTLYTPEQRAAFIAQFAAIANRRPPAGLPPEAAAPLEAKFVFSLRSDFLYLLDELSADIPAILRCRFQLRPLDHERAFAAITRPAAMPGPFASPPFRYSPAALEGILEALGRKGASSLGAAAPSAQTPETPLGEIAAFQLQMLCQHLETKLIQQKQPADFEITPAFYGHAEGIDRIINEFYHSVLDKVPATEQEAVQKLLARGLIRNGRRIMMEASAMRDEYGVAQAALELLHAERLLKRETRKGELYYEISHDTLVAPVLERFKAIEEAELRAKAEEAERQLAEERRRVEAAERLRKEAVAGKRRAQKMLGWAIGMASLACVGLLGAWYLYRQSEAEKQRAETERNKAIQSDSLAQVATREAVAQSLAAQRSDSLAQVNLVKAKTEEANAKAALAKAQAAEQAKQKTEITRLLNEADTYQRAKLYKNARARLEAVLRLDPGHTEAKQKWQQLQQ